MSMTQKDFEAMADAVRRAKSYLEEDDDAGREALNIAARQLAGACAQQYRGSYGFNRAKFLDACGFPPAHGN